MKPALRPLGLYIHIPFCRQKCSYCDFYSLAGREDRMDDYTAALRAHLAEAAPFVSGYTVDTLAAAPPAAWGRSGWPGS